MRLVTGNGRYKIGDTDEEDSDQCVLCVKKIKENQSSKKCGLHVIFAMHDITCHLQRFVPKDDLCMHLEGHGQPFMITRIITP